MPRRASALQSMAVRQLLIRAINDADLRAQLYRDPQNTIQAAGIAVTGDDLAAITEVLFPARYTILEHLAQRIPYHTPMITIQTLTATKENLEWDEDEITSLSNQTMIS